MSLDLETVGLWIGSHAGLIFCFCIRRQNSLCLLSHLFLGRDGKNLLLGGPILEVLPGRRLTGLAAVAVMGSTSDWPFRTGGPGAGHLLQKGGIEDQELSVFFVILVQN